MPWGVGVPSGTVTFLFTDIEGSTRLWQQDGAAMRDALSRHDAIVRAAIEGHGGYVFSTGGDGFAAAFARADEAVGAAVESQIRLAAEPWAESASIRVRMGVHTGAAEERDGDYFGTPVNEAARLMAVGHGGQLLCSAVTAGLIDADVKVLDLGEHRLRDLSGVIRVFQVCTDGLPVDFAPLRTVDAAPGNLPVLSTSFVGRDEEVAELVALVGSHRLVTLTGVGGVGKTRLAVQVAAELVGEFPDGVWLVELAPVGDPAAVADATAVVLGVNAQAGTSVVETVARTLSGRQLLVVDNCEHVLDAAAELVEAILAHTTAVAVIATSREGLRVGAEHLWAVPSLDTRDGPTSDAVELFVERARAVETGFSLENEDDRVAVTEICQRLDGIALAIELAAARMVSMNPAEVRDRLGDRFRLLSGSRRGLERHQTLRQAVGWSYDLLDDEERMVLMRCAVFAGGFDLAAARSVCGDDRLDEYAMLDLVDSLVRKSLVTAEQILGHTRYGLLETIRQFAEEQLATTGAIAEVRDLHARWFAEQAVAHWDLFDGPDQLVALNWVDLEFANLRAGFRWAADHEDLVSATAIAANIAQMATFVQRYEPVGWAEEILEAATAADVAQLTRLYIAASLCAITGRPEVALRYAQTGAALAAEPRSDPFDPAWYGMQEAVSHLMAGRMDRWLEISAVMAAQSGLAHVMGLCGLLNILPMAGRAEEAMAIAEETLATARARGNPFIISYAMSGYGLAFVEADPIRALGALREGLLYAQQHRLSMYEMTMARWAARLESVHRDLGQALSLYETSIDTFHRAGDVANLAAAIGDLVVLFDRLDRPEVVATLYGAMADQGITVAIPGFTEAAAHARAALDEGVVQECSAAGTAMELADAVRYARRQIQLARPVAQ